MEVQPAADTQKTETDEKRSGILKQILFVFLGCVFVALGIIGIPIPILPTTPFMLLAGYFFLRSLRNLIIGCVTIKFFKRFFKKERNDSLGKDSP